MTAVQSPAGSQRVPVSRAVRAIALVAGCLGSVAPIVRVVGDAGAADRLWYLGLGGVFLGLFVVGVLRPPAREWQAHALLAIQCLLAWRLLAIEPHWDWLVNLYIPLAAEAAVVFAGRTVWYWVAALAALTVGPLMVYLDPLRGLSLSLVTVALEIALAASLVFARELDEARRRSQQVLAELQQAHARVQQYAARAAEAAAAEERERVARDLNESVARRIAGILAATATAREAVAASPASGGELPADAAGDASSDAATALLAALQADAQAALAQMRRLIAELRPQSGPSA